MLSTSPDNLTTSPSTPDDSPISPSTPEDTPISPIKGFIEEDKDSGHDSDTSPRDDKVFHQNISLKKCFFFTFKNHNKQEYAPVWVSQPPNNIATLLVLMVLRCYNRVLLVALVILELLVAPVVLEPY